MHFTNNQASKREPRSRGAQEKGTPRAGREESQINQAQFRAKSGAPVAGEDGAEWEAIEFAGWTGRVQVKSLGATNEMVFWLPVGTDAGAGCESGAGFAMQQGMM